MNNQLFRLFRKPPTGLFGLLLFCSLSFWMNGQAMLSPSVISAEGGRIETPSMTLDWTLGETFVSDSNIDGHRLTEGFHQPVLTVEMPEIPATTTAEKLKIVKTQKAQTVDDRANPQPMVSTVGNVAISIWPNPVCENLTIRVASDELQNVQFQLFDALGNLLENSTPLPVNSAFELSMNDRPNGFYFLHFLEADGKLLGSRKITLAR